MATPTKPPTRKSMLARIADFDIRPHAARVLREKKYRRIIIAVLAIITLVILSGIVFGWIGPAYEWLWMITTAWTGNPRPYTQIMRENPWIYLVIAFTFVIVPLILFPRRVWDISLAVYATFWAGFLGGHVFW